MDVLFDRKGRNPGQLAGRSPYLQPVQIEEAGLAIGDIAEVEIVEVGANSLFGRLTGAKSRDNARMEAVA
jgi:tRNA-2-methylthio-N6-dimethylallyladenosine synthase